MHYASFSRLPLVPVVFGGGNYQDLVPAGSYINVDNFKSVDALTSYLKYLDTDHIAYRSMLDWKSEYVMYERWPLCSLCQQLHQGKLSHHQVYSNTYSWWYQDEIGDFLCQQ